ncbi:MAG TPA: hypothetical protein VF078_00235 [Nitrospira sp.]
MTVQRVAIAEPHPTHVRTGSRDEIPWELLRRQYDRTPQARWNREAFKLLSQLFQMTVTEVPRAGVPSITIAK